MPKLYSSKKISKILEKNSFFFISQHGSHAKYRKDGDPNLTVILPMNRKEIPYGTFQQAHLQEAAFQ